MVDLAELRRIDLFTELDDEALALWAQAAEVEELPAGVTLAEQGADSPLWLLLEGEIASVLVDGDTAEPAGLHTAPTWMGALAIVTEAPMGVDLRTETPVRLAHVPAATALSLILTQRPVHRRVMQAVRPVMNRLAGIEQSRERLASLGTMAAGLAHELNNPAAAARRASAAMCEEVAVLSSTIGHFVAAGMEREEAEVLVGLQREALDAAEGRTALSALDAADAEDELRDALDDLGVAEGWKYAEALAAAGLDADWLARVAAAADGAMEPAIGWLAATLNASKLASEIADSTQRMSELVGAVKTYAYMDQGEVVDVDVREGLETTLVILAHKLKHTHIAVVRDYDPELPTLIARGGELNQVWTNLLDNAIAALGDTGTITIRTRRDDDCAVIEIADDGPGVPAELRDRIFDPFFTTKGVGEGTGLGLDTARNIVAGRHRGSLTFTSRPGETVFRVRLPLSGAAR